LVGIVACVLFTAWATLTSVKLPVLNRELLDLGPLNFGLHPVLIGVFNHVVVFVVGLGASLWFARNATPDSAVAEAAAES
jgi:SSS family solute:Na+ symporter